MLRLRGIRRIRQTADPSHIVDLEIVPLTDIHSMDRVFELSSVVDSSPADCDPSAENLVSSFFLRKMRAIAGLIKRQIVTTEHNAGDLDDTWRNVVYSKGIRRFWSRRMGGDAVRSRENRRK